MPNEAPEQPSELAEHQLCTSCAAPNDPHTDFCVKCGAPLSSYSMFGPFERLFAEGYIYREAVYQPRRLITVIGVWILFGIPALGGLAILAVAPQAPHDWQLIVIESFLELPCP